MGFFLRKTVLAGFDAQGVEPSRSLAKIAREQFGLTITNSYFEAATFVPKSFDVVTMIDVFEHVINPLQLLASAHTVLADDGLLCVKVPNGNYNLLKLELAQRMGKPKMDIWDSYEHVVHYTPETMAKMLEKAGFQVRKLVLPPPCSCLGRDGRSLLPVPLAVLDGLEAGVAPQPLPRGRSA